MLQLSVGFLAALALALFGYYYGEKDASLKSELLNVIFGIVFIMGALFLGINKMLGKIEERLGWNIESESEGRKLKKKEISLLKVFFEKSNGIAGMQYELNTLFPNAEIDGKAILPTIDKLQREGYVSKSRFTGHYSITDLGVNYIILEEESAAK
jgi:hypothetical protein